MTAYTIAFPAPAARHQFIVIRTSLSSSASSKFGAVMTAPAAIRSASINVVRTPIVAMPAAVAD